LAVTGGAVGAAFAPLWRILSDGRISADESVALLSGLLGNPALERLFVRAPLSADDLSGLSVDAVDGLLSSTAFRVESEDALLDCLLKLGPTYFPLLRHIQPTFLSPDGLCALVNHLTRPHESMGLSPRKPSDPFSSLIVSDFLEIFAEFRGKRFWLRSRGSRDGFRADDLHSRSDGHMNTLTVILDTNGTSSAA
jgi:hypothetical protein